MSIYSATEIYRSRESHSLH